MNIREIWSSKHLYQVTGMTNFLMGKPCVNKNIGVSPTRQHRLTGVARRLLSKRHMEITEHWEIDPWRFLIIAIHYLSHTSKYIRGRLQLKAGCKWYRICTKWVENLLFEVILKRSEAYLGQKPEEYCFLIKKILSRGQRRRFCRKIGYFKR